MAKFVVLLLLLAYIRTSVQGQCLGDDANYLYKNKMTCGEVLAHYKQHTFCTNPDILKNKCCMTWAETCSVKQGYWDCPTVTDEEDNTLENNMVCDGKNDCANGEDETNCNTGNVTGDYVVELLVVVDPRAQAPYLLENNNNKAEADKSILADIDYFLTEVNKLYSNFFESEITMRISKLKVILLDKDFLADDVVDGKFVDEDISLNNFNKYLADTSAKETLNYDHALLFSGYTFGQPGDSAVVGYATVGTICQIKKATSIIEYDGTYGLVTTVAHEIGHNLGARHDETGTPFIMSMYTNQDERWTFSHLSTEKLKNTITRLDKIDNNCLLETARPSVTYNILNSPVTPALADPDVVCERFYGKGAYYEPRMDSWLETGKPGLPSGDLLCNEIWCKIQGKKGLSVAYSSDGWPCGKQKTCYEGECVPSTSGIAANIADDTCVFGDVRIVEHGLTCEQNLNKLGNADFCHDSSSERGCCETYARVCTKGKCTYGDMTTLSSGRTCTTSLETYGKSLFCKEKYAVLFKNQCCESYPKVCADQGKCTYGDMTLDDGQTCTATLDTYGKSLFCMEKFAPLFKNQCCETYPKVCADQGRKRTLIDLLETIVARETNKGQKLDALVAKGLDYTAHQEPVFEEPVVEHVKRDDIAPEPLRSEKLTLVDRWVEKREENEKKTLSDDESKEPVFEDPVVEHVKRDDIAPEPLRSEKRTLIDRLLEKLEQMENDEARPA